MYAVITYKDSPDDTAWIQKPRFPKVVLIIFIISIQHFNHFSLELVWDRMDT